MRKKIFAILLMSLVCSLNLIYSPVHAAGSAEFQLTADKLKAEVGDIVLFTMTGKNIKDLYAFEAKFTYDPDKLELLKAETPIKGFSVSPIKKDKEITFAHTKIGNSAGEKGDLTIGTLSFKVKQSGTAVVRWDAMKSVDSQLKSEDLKPNQSVSVDVLQGTAAVTFTDIKGHWAEASIVEAAGKGIINGYPDGKFQPNGSITRTQFAVILSRALQLEEQISLDFADADQIPAWAKEDVAKAVKAGLIQGYQDRTFRGDRAITRAEIAAMVARSLKLQEGDGSHLTFADSGSIPAWAKGWVEVAVENGIIEGRGGNRFVPGDNATRAEATVMVLRLLKVVE